MRDQPGPGEYKYKNMSVGVDARKFSFLQRTKNVLEPENLMAKSNVPGPGTYALVAETNSVGKYPLSTTPNSRAANWSPSKCRFPDPGKRTRGLPGPGSYTPSDIESTTNSYILSKHRNGGNVKFIKPRMDPLRSKTPMNERTFMNRTGTITPGPGTYVLPSDFGYL
jgi:hypothetical protein